MITLAEYLIMQRRRENRSRLQSPIATTSSGSEADLQNQIADYCRTEGWIALRGSMAHRTHRTKGEADFTILASRGRKFLVECKTKTGKLSTDQLALKMQAESLGHAVAVVRSFQDFLELVG
jgi:hypothetical protein